MVAKYRGVLVATVLGAMGLGMAGGAYADLFGEVPILTNIYVTSLQELAQLQQSLQSLKNAYNEVRQVEQYATAAQKAFATLQQARAAFAHNSALSAFVTVYPEVAYLQGKTTTYGGSWFSSTPGYATPSFQTCLQALTLATSKNLAPASACTAWMSQSASSQLSTNLQATFGAVPASRPDLVAARTVTQNSYTEALRQTQIRAVVAGKVQRLQEQCANATQSGVECAQAGAHAQIEAMDQQAETNRLLAEIGRNQSLANELRVAEAVREENQIQVAQMGMRAMLVEVLSIAGTENFGELSQQYGLSTPSGTGTAATPTAAASATTAQTTSAQPGAAPGASAGGATPTTGAGLTAL